MAQTIPEELTKPYHIYADETCQTKHRWMALGVTIVAEEHADHVRAKLRACKHAMRLQGEIKWTRTDDSNIERYKRFANIYMYLVERGIIEFHCMLICMDVVDYRALGDDVPEFAYNRFFHHLLMKLCRIRLRESKYFIKFDRRTSLVPLRPFCTAACFAAKRDYGLDHWPFRQFVYQESKLDMILQVNDLILGAIGFIRNGKEKVMPTMDTPKAELARYINKISPLHSFWRDSGKDNKTFTLWAIRFGGKQGKEAFRNREKFLSKQEKARKAARRKKARKSRKPRKAPSLP
jgi:hypothetical protein